MTDATKVAIIGAGGFGREVLQYCEDARRDGWPYDVAGFVDDRPDALAGFTLPVRVLGGLEELAQLEVEAFVIAIGVPSVRRAMADKVRDAGGALATLLHPTAYVAPTATVGDGALLCPFTLVAAHGALGADVAMNVYASVGHDAHVGDHCVLSPYTAVTGSVVLGDESFLGTHCTVAPGTTIGRQSSVASGSVVTRDAEPGSLLAGNPANGRVMYKVT